MNRAGAGIKSQDFEPVPAHHLDGAAVFLPFLGCRLFFKLPPVLPAGEENPAYIQCRDGEGDRCVEKRIAEACVRFSVWVRRHDCHHPEKILRSKQVSGYCSLLACESSLGSWRDPDPAEVEKANRAGH